jgi:serine/threonine protein kinase
MPPNPFPPSDVLAAFGGRFALALPELRVGGQGVVYKARRTHDKYGNVTGDDVALKLHLNSGQDERVEREITAMTNVQHPCLATLLEEGTETVSGRRSRYVVWALIEGEPLDVTLQRGGIGEKQTARIARDVVSALSAIWSKHIVHRDVTPKNIMVRPDGSAVLIDLGGARHLDETTVTATGATFGTLGYLSPEQSRGERTLTSASDVFALAIVLVQCLTGTHPTGGNQALLNASPPRPATVVPHVSTGMQQILDRMLHQRASFRPSLSELEREFEQMMR